MEYCLRYVAIIFVLVGAMFWVGADNFGIGDPTIDAKAQTSTCVIKSDAGDTACSSVTAAVLASLDDGDQDGMQRAAPSGVVLTSQSATSSEIGRHEAPSGATQSDFEAADVEPAEVFSDVETTDEEPQYIGEFIDPDAEDFGSDASDGVPVSIGEFIDPDDDFSYNANDVEQVIGAFIDPDGG